MSRQGVSLARRERRVQSVFVRQNLGVALPEVWKVVEDEMFSIEIHHHSSMRFTRVAGVAAFAGARPIRGPPARWGRPGRPSARPRPPISRLRIRVPPMPYSTLDSRFTFCA